MKLSVVIPVYNEEKTISELLKRVKDVEIEKEIVVVNDYSNDKTKEILEKIKERNIKIIHHTKNQGKGAAIRTGLNNITGDLVIIQDADLEYDPKDYKKLIAPIIKGEATIVY